MGLIKFNEDIYYLPHESINDRPMLAYIFGEKFSVMVDAGNSKRHIETMYKELASMNLPLPQYTIITHWHWDHTLGLNDIYGQSIVHKLTNKILREEIEKYNNEDYINQIKLINPCFNYEYEGIKTVFLKIGDIEFEGELTINIGNDILHIKHIESPHTIDSVIINLEKNKILFLGDATSEDYENNGYLDNGKLGKLINEIEISNCKYCMLGHAEPLLKKDLLQYLYSLL